MKALSIKQPFAHLIVTGKKMIELRTWNTKFRGEFYIHASGKPDVEAMEKFGFTDLLCGCLVGKAELVEVKNYSSEDEFDQDTELHKGRSFSPFGFVLKNAEEITPIPCKGRLNFWEVSEDLLE